MIRPSNLNAFSVDLRHQTNVFSRHTLLLTLKKMYMSATYVTTEHKLNAIMIPILKAVTLDINLTNVTTVVRNIYI